MLERLFKKQIEKECMKYFDWQGKFQKLVEAQVESWVHNCMINKINIYLYNNKNHLEELIINNDEIKQKIVDKIVNLQISRKGK